MIDSRSGVLIPDDFGTRLTVEWLKVCPWNPNKQSPKVFKNLVNGIRDEGFLEAIQVVPMDDEMAADLLTEEESAEDHPWYVIVGGAHRYDAARTLDMAEVPVVVKHGWTYDDVKNKNVALNARKGKQDPEKFAALYGEMLHKQGERATREAMGMVEDRELKKLLRSIQKDLPKELSDTLAGAGDDIESTDQLSRILNEMFSKYGDQMAVSIMAFEFGSKTHWWFEMERDTKDLLDTQAKWCIDNGVDFNVFLTYLMTDEAALKRVKKDALQDAKKSDVEY